MNKYKVGDTCKVTSINIDYGNITIVGFAGVGKSSGIETNIYLCKMEDGTLKQISELLLEYNVSKL